MPGENRKMTAALAGIISDLEKRRAAVEKALMALKEIDEDNVPEWVSGSTATAIPAPAKRRRSKKVREAMRQAQLFRYRKLRSEA